MRFKRGVDASGVHPRLWQFLMWLDQVHLEWTEEELWVTCLRRSYRASVNTRHATAVKSVGDPRAPSVSGWSARGPTLVTAVDIRRWALDELEKAEAFCRHVQGLYGDQIGVVLEPEWLSARRRKKMTAPHIHFQLKKPIRWTTLI